MPSLHSACDETIVTPTAHCHTVYATFTSAAAGVKEFTVFMLLHTVSDSGRRWHTLHNYVCQ